MLSDRHAHAAALIEAGREDDAWGEVQGLLRADPDDAAALFMLGNLHAKAEQMTSAWLAFRRALELRPSDARLLNNAGMALEGMGRTRDARGWFERAHKRDPAHAGYLANIGLTHLLEGDTRRAIEYADRAIALRADDAGARTCRGFAMLAEARWAEGWDDYRYALGGKYRPVVDYGLPRWDGESDAHVIVCGEQGIGDELMYATCLPDLAARVREVTLECDARLAKLMRRSFGDRMTVHGTRGRDKPWLAACGATHQVMAGELPRHYRRSADAFPGAKFLQLDADLVSMYETLLERHAGDRVRIGLMMSGGNAITGRKRAIGPAAFAPLVRALEGRAEFFSLEYRPGSQDAIEASGLPIRHFHFVVGQGADFDHTAAFISRLDHVVGVHTSAMHAAGALGVPTVALVPAQPSWQYGVGLGDRFPWYGAVRLFRQRPSESWAQCVDRFASGWRP